MGKTIAEAARADRGQSRLNLRIPRAIAAALEAAARRLKTTRAGVVVAALAAYLQPNKRT